MIVKVVKYLCIPRIRIYLDLDISYFPFLKYFAIPSDNREISEFVTTIKLKFVFAYVRFFFFLFYYISFVYFIMFRFS